MLGLVISFFIIGICRWYWDLLYFVIQLDDTIVTTALTHGIRQLQQDAPCVFRHKSADVCECNQIALKLSQSRRMLVRRIHVAKKEWRVHDKHELYKKPSGMNNVNDFRVCYVWVWDGVPCGWRHVGGNQRNVQRNYCHAQKCKKENTGVLHTKVQMVSPCKRCWQVKAKTVINKPCIIHVYVSLYSSYMYYVHMMHFCRMVDTHKDVVSSRRCSGCVAGSGAAQNLSVHRVLRQFHYPQQEWGFDFDNK